ncbi:MAG: hypothetical protein PHU14_05770 [Methylovulum sp.]|nr:hypothetical protein [Methylovulum sp.]
MKNIIRAMALCAVSVFPVLASAGTPGQYDVGGIQTLCLQSNGTWFGSFPGWGGRWSKTNANIFIRGNYASGAGNDAMVFKKLVGTWIEWRDDFSWDDVSQGVVLTKTSATCSITPSSAVPGADVNPLGAASH